MPSKRKKAEEKEEEPENQAEPSSSSDDEEGDSGSDGSDDDSDEYPEVSDEEDDEDEEDGGGDEREVVDVDFEFGDIKEEDFHGLRALLTNLLDGQQPFSLSQLAEFVIAQEMVGLVIRPGEGEDPLGLATVLSLRRDSQQPFAREIREFLLKGCPDDEARRALESDWRPGAGLLINVRLLNAPPQLGPPLQQQLFQEIEWATEDAATQEERDNYKFDKYILLDRVFVDPADAAVATGTGTGVAGTPTGGGGGGGPGPSKKPKKGKKKKGKGKQALGGIAPGNPGQGGQGQVQYVYTMPESEVYHKHASWSYTFPVAGRPVAKGELMPMRLVAAITPQQAAKARQELDKLIGNAAAANNG